MEPYRRHIIVDNIGKTVYIEVQPALNGNPKLHEYRDIKDGYWHKYVPAEMRQQFADAINNGYTVQPMINQGGKNEQFYIVQVVSIEEKGIMI